MFGKLKIRKNVNVGIFQLAAFTLFLNLSFPNDWELKQTEMASVLKSAQSMDFYYKQLLAHICEEK